MAAEEVIEMQGLEPGVPLSPRDDRRQPAGYGADRI